MRGGVARALLFGMALMLAACSGEPGAQPEPSVPAGTDVMLVEERVTLGRTVPGGWAPGALRLKAGPEGAVLTQVAPSCGCTISKTTVPLTIAPGEVVEAPLAFDLLRLSDRGAPEGSAPRLIERSVAVASARGTRLTATATLMVSHQVVVEPPQGRFATVAPGRETLLDMIVRPAPGAPMPKVLGIDLPRSDLSSSIEPVEGGILVRLTWLPGVAESMDEVIMLRLDDGDPVPISLRIAGTAEPVVTVDPPSVIQLSASTSKPVVARLTLHRPDGHPLGILGVSCNNHRVEVRIDPGEGPVRTLQVLVPVMALPQEVQGTILIRTSVEGAEAIEVPVHVRARG